jgi:hypothetical protein
VNISQQMLRSEKFDNDDDDDDNNNNNHHSTTADGVLMTGQSNYFCTIFLTLKI